MGITGSHFETFDFFEVRLFRTLLVWRLTLFNKIWAYKIKLTDKIMTS